MEKQHQIKCDNSHCQKNGNVTLTIITSGMYNQREKSKTAIITIYIYINKNIEENILSGKAELNEKWGNFLAWNTLKMVSSKFNQ